MKNEQKSGKRIANVRFDGGFVLMLFNVLYFRNLDCWQTDGCRQTKGTLRAAYDGSVELDSTKNPGSRETQLSQFT